MKKWLVGLIGVLLIFLVFIYLLIPNAVILKNNIAIKVTGPGLHRMLLDTNNVSKWWPGKIAADSFLLNGFTYKISAGNITVMPISITNANIGITTSLFLTTITPDSTKLQWVGSMATSYNPVNRLLLYFKAKEINRGMAQILQKMENFYSKPANIYGYGIQKTQVADTILISTLSSCKGYPTTQFIYYIIDKLKSYALKNGAKQSGYPMLNIITADSINYDVKVALPINMQIPPSGDIVQKRMPAFVDFFMIEVTGGANVAAHAFEQIHVYATDYRLKAPALPFYSLITDRSKEADSSKWITKIYFPFM